jgi:serine protease Do
MTMSAFIRYKIPLLIFLLALSSCSSSNKENVAGQAAPQNLAAPTVALPDFVTLTKQLGPAVVNISTTRTVRENIELPNILPDDPFFGFFRRFMPPSGPREFLTRSLGSGFILSEDGYILTNAHVVANTDEVIVKLITKKEYKAKVIGADLRTDIALLKIDGTGLPVVRAGDPAKTEVGEWVIAIGAPFGFENSVTDYVPFIQTDVAVNPGNSGGPLFNMQGEVIGINSQIYSRTGGYMGLSFATPIDIAMGIVQQLRTSGKITRGRIGVQVQELSGDLAASFGLKDATGALVSVVEKDGPAAKAGVLPGDIIKTVDGKPIQTSSDLVRLVAASKPETAVSVQLWRKGAMQTVKIIIGESVETRAETAGKTMNQDHAANRAGLTLQELTSEQRNSIGVDHGLGVIDAAGAAARSGIQRGDIILAINDIPVTTLAHFENQIKDQAGKSIALLIKRDADTLYISLKLE